MREVNRLASKSGLQFQYEGRTDDPKAIIESYERQGLRYWESADGRRSYYGIGLRIVDSATKEVVYMNKRVNDADELETAEAYKVN